MDEQTLSIKREQFRQAKRIHGGLAKLLAAHLAVKLSRLHIPGKAAAPARLPRRLRQEVPAGPGRARGRTAALGVPVAQRPVHPRHQGRVPAHPRQRAQFLCPCDGTVQEVGRIEGGRILTLKGIEYTLPSLLPGIDVRPFEGGHFAVVFLSPIDCHRVFSPQDGHAGRVTTSPATGCWSTRRSSGPSSRSTR